MKVELINPPNYDPYELSPGDLAQIVAPQNHVFLGRIVLATNTHIILLDNPNEYWVRDLEDTALKFKRLPSGTVIQLTQE